MNFCDKAAGISDCGTYRYWLRRGWGNGYHTTAAIPFVLWVLLNPSIANAQVDDPTVRKGAGFTEAWGYKRMVFVNLYAFRSTYPADLKRRAHIDKVGPDNDECILAHARDPYATKTVVAWGQDPVKGSTRVQQVLSLLESVGKPLLALGINKSGHPKHPLMLGYDIPLVEYNYERHSCPRGDADIQVTREEHSPGAGPG